MEALRAWCHANDATLLDALTEHGAGVLLVARRGRLARDVIVEIS